MVNQVHKGYGGGKDHLPGPHFLLCDCSCAASVSVSGVPLGACVFGQILLVPYGWNRFPWQGPVLAELVEC